jgi:hypothetical protein
MKKCLLAGRVTTSILQDCVNCVLHIRSEVSKFCVVLLHKGSCFEKCHSLTNYLTIYMQYLQSGAQEHNLQCKTISKSILWGCTLKVFETSGHRGYLIKKPSGRQILNKASKWIATR